MPPKVQPFADVCNHRFTMASADFSPFVVTDGFHIVPCGYTLFLSADETSLGTTRHFLSIYLPHLLQLIPSSYWTLVCCATLSLTIASCGFCSSDRRFAIRLPSDSTSQWTPLPLASGSHYQARNGLSPSSCCPCWAHVKKEVSF